MYSARFTNTQHEASPVKLLVLGGSGFLSRVVAEEAVAAGHTVSVVTRGNRPLPEGVTALRGDRKDPESLLPLLEGRPFDAVVDCLCYNPSDAELSLRAFSGRVQRYVMISTDFVYGTQRTLPMDEDTPTKALSEYGRHKAACEEILFAAHQAEGFPATVLRPPHIMGAGGQLGTGSLQGRDPMLLDRLRRYVPIPLLEGGQLLIQPVVHRDIAKACFAVINADAAVGKAYNVAGPDCVTTREYYQLVAATIGVEYPEYFSFPSIVYMLAYPERSPFTHHRAYSTDRLARDTGYRPQTTLAHAIFEMVDWLQASGEAKPYVETPQDQAVYALFDAYFKELRKVLPNSRHP
jgi:nucleoside-diphosphate-sugar epimerase